MLQDYPIPAEYCGMANDLLKLLTIVVVMVLMRCVNGAWETYSAFCAVYVIMGLCAYWMIVHQLVRVHDASSVPACEGVKDDPDPLKP